MRWLSLMVIALGLAAPVRAAEPPALARARAFYNAADYDGAIAAAAQALTVPGAGDAASLVEARARLERYRRSSDPLDLTTARDRLRTLRPAALSPRDQVDLLVGLGQTLYLDNLFGPAVELFDTALQRAATVPAVDRRLLLDWWATALDRNAQASPSDRRARLYEQLDARMEGELRLDPGSAPANYWRAVAKRGAGDVDGAWDAAVAAWVRAPLGTTTATALRVDIDRLVTQALIPERVRTRPLREQAEAVDALHAQWELVKQQYAP